VVGGATSGAAKRAPETRPARASRAVLEGSGRLRAGALAAALGLLGAVLPAGLAAQTAGSLQAKARVVGAGPAWAGWAAARAAAGTLAASLGRGEVPGGGAGGAVPGRERAVPMARWVVPTAGPAAELSEVWVARTPGGAGGGESIVITIQYLRN
jgi:hypothetical protein